MTLQTVSNAMAKLFLMLTCVVSLSGFARSEHSSASLSSMTFAHSTATATRSACQAVKKLYNW